MSYLHMSIKMIYDAEDDPILQDSSQDPSGSSKYDFKDKGSWRF